MTTRREHLQFAISLVNKEHVKAVQEGDEATAQGTMDTWHTLVDIMQSMPKVQRKNT